MKRNLIYIKKVEVLQFDPRTNQSKCGIKYLNNNEPKALVIECCVERAEKIARNILETIKEQEKVEKTSEDIFDVTVTEFANDEKTEEILTNFFGRLCDKTRRLKHERNHTAYMKLYDEIRMEKLMIR